MTIISEFVLGFWSWWYFERHAEILQRLAAGISRAASLTGFDIHSRYIFVPLYQDHSFWGRLISFPIRLFLFFLSSSLQVVALGIAALCWAIYILLPLTPVISVVMWWLQ